MVRALQITGLRVEAFDVSCRIFSVAFAAELVDPRDFLGRQTVLFHVKGNGEWAEIIRKNQSETLPAFLVRADVKLGRRKINYYDQRSGLINLRLNSV